VVPVCADGGGRFGGTSWCCLWEEPAKPPIIHSQTLFSAASSHLSGSLVVPNAIAPIEVMADLRAGKISCRLTVPAPRQRKTAQGRVTWLTRQLKDPPPNLMIQVTAMHPKKPGPSCLVARAAEDPSVVLDGPKTEVRDLTLTLIRPAGTKRGRGKGSFIDSTIELVEDFYKRVVQDLKPAVPTAPKVRSGAAGTPPGDPVLEEILTEAPDSEAVPSDGQRPDATLVEALTQRFDLPALPAG
jgi:hypothetical protein